jgi:predicted DNA-binding transcriptional regulator YafY
MSSKYPNLERLKLILDYGLNKYRSKREYILHLENNGLIISDRTLNRDFDQLKKIGFNVYYDAQRMKHYINDEFAEKQVLIDRMVELESIKSFEEDYSELYQKYVIDGESNSKGIEYIRPIFNTIDQRLVLSFDYFKFNGIESKREIYPLRLKMSQHRWYVIGHDTSKNALRKFGLDRIQNISSGQKFKISEIPQSTLKELDLQKHYYGISERIFKKENIQKIVLKVSKHLIEYWRSKPIHFSQEVVGKTKEGDYFVELYLIPNIDLVKLIISSLGEIKIIEPIELKKYIRKHYSDFFKHFIDV